MKDIPVFTTDNGVASLALQQIPHTGFAHITVHSASAFSDFLQECVGFCRAVGAERVFACGHKDLEQYPIYARVLSMQMPIPEDVEQACLFPVTVESLDKWLDIYNTGMKDVPNAVALSKRAGKELVKKGTAYFVHENGNVLGIGVVEDDTVSAIVSCQKGAGELVMNSLFGALCGDIVKVEVAENNTPAMRLYQRMCFVTTGILKTWYDVTKIF